VNELSFGEKKEITTTATVELRRLTRKIFEIRRLVEVTFWRLSV